MLTSLLSRRICLSGEWRAKLPMLEARINAYVPATLRAARLIIMFAVALVVLDAWHAFNLPAWLQSDSGRSMIAMIIRVAIILLIAAFTLTVVASIIVTRLSSIPGRKMPSERKSEERRVG